MPPTYRLGKVEIDLARFEVRRDGEVVAVEPQVFDLLAYLATAGDRLVSKEELLDNIWGDRFVSESALTSRVKAARRAVGDDGRTQAIIATVHGRGYRLVPPVELVEAEVARAQLPPLTPPSGPVLERDEAIGLLADAMREASAGRGRVVCVYGEAGIGKTTLLRSFAQALTPPARLVVGGCVDLVTPSPLSPVMEVLRRLDSGFGTGSERDRVTAMKAVEIIRADVDARGGPLLVALEDVHWADDATLDVAVLLARSLATLPLTLVLTFRVDALDDDHPLRRVLAALRETPMERVRLRPLSESAIAELARGAGRTTAELMATTNGNPLLVTEMLRADQSRVSPSIADFVSARLARLPADSRAAVEQLAVSPLPVELALASELLGHTLDSLTAAERGGIIAVEAGAIEFRHELVRMAVVDQLPEVRRITCHRRLRDELDRVGADASRIVHHAAACGDVDSILHHGSIAASQAVATDAHRQAVEHLSLVLDHADRIDDMEEAALRSRLAHELHLLRRVERGAEEAQRAVELYRSAGERKDVAKALVMEARLQATRGRLDEALELARSAVDILERESPGRELGRAYAELSLLIINQARFSEAAEAADRALAIARRFDDQVLEASALNYLGVAAMALGQPHGEHVLRQAISLAEAAGSREHMIRASSNLAFGLWLRGSWAEAAELIEATLAKATVAEYASAAYNLSVMKCHVLLSRGLMDEALSLVDTLSEEDTPLGWSFELTVLRAMVQMRQGGSAGSDTLRRLWADTDVPAPELAHEQSLLLLVALAELAWLTCDRDLGAEIAAAADPLDWAPSHGTEYGQLMLYLTLLGRRDQDGGGLIHPFDVAVDGRWTQAAEMFAALERPYEQAVCLIGADTETARDDALRIFGDMGARWTADQVGQWN